MAIWRRENIHQHVNGTAPKFSINSKKNGKGCYFSFPKLYGFSADNINMAEAEDKTNTFPTVKSQDTVEVFKLHGSLNWFSKHHSENINKDSILNKNRKLHIANFSYVPSGFTHTDVKKYYTFPLIIPPILNKASVINKSFHQLWNKTEKYLSDAEEVVIFGYSCPQTDYEAANLFRRTLKKSTPKKLIVIDPNPNVVLRYTGLSDIEYIRYFRKVEAYLEHNK